jgi:hypothetical protein
VIVVESTLLFPLSSNYGVEWDAKFNDVPRYWTGLAINSTAGGFLVAHDADSGTYISHNFGDTWTAARSGNNFGAVTCDYFVEYIALGTTADGFIYVSSNHGGNWASYQYTYASFHVTP